MKHRINLLVLLVILLFPSSCSDSFAPKAADLIVAGSEYQGGGITRALSFKGLTKEYLDESSYSDLAGHVRSGSDVYYFGFERNTTTNNNIPTYWKGKNKYTLPLTYTGIEFNAADIADMVIDGNDVYALGNLRTANKSYIGYWKNSVLTVINTKSNFAYSSKINIHNGIVLIIGYENNLSSSTDIKIWRNDEEIILMENKSVGAAKAVANGEFIYSYVDSVTPFRKFGYVVGDAITEIKPQNEGERVFIYAMTRAGDDIYCAGYVRVGKRNIAALWKNGDQILLNNPENTSGLITAIYVENSDVYATGTMQEDKDGSFDNSNNRVVVWKNSKMEYLTTDTFDSYTYSISF